MDILFFIIFAVVAGIILLGAVAMAFSFFKTARFTGKVFDQVAGELERQREQSRRIACGHCGTMIAPGEKCPNCGASAS